MNATPEPPGLPVLGHLWPWTTSPLRLLEDWIDASYRAVTPKRLLAELDALRQPRGSSGEQLA